MSSVANRETILDFISSWIPSHCSVCVRSPIAFGWHDGPFLCRGCADLAIGEDRIRLLRVQDMRGLLGFGQDDAGISVRRALRTLEQDPPPVIAHPLGNAQLRFLKAPLLAGYTYEMYCVHGLSRWPPNELNNNAFLRSSALEFWAIPAPAQAIAHHGDVTDSMAALFGSIGEEPPRFAAPQSMVSVILGIAIIPDTEPYARSLLRWEPEAPWASYYTSEHRVDFLSGSQRAELTTAARQFTDSPNRPGKPRGRNKRDRNWYLDALREHARAVRRIPTQAEFSARFGVNPKTLRKNLKDYGLWPWETFLKRGLASHSRSTTIKV